MRHDASNVDQTLPQTIIMTKCLETENTGCGVIPRPLAGLRPLLAVRVRERGNPDAPSVSLSLSLSLSLLSDQADASLSRAHRSHVTHALCAGVRCCANGRYLAEWTFSNGQMHVASNACEGTGNRPRRCACLADT